MNTDENKKRRFFAAGSFNGHEAEFIHGLGNVVFHAFKNRNVEIYDARVCVDGQESDIDHGSAILSHEIRKGARDPAALGQLGKGFGVARQEQAAICDWEFGL